MRSHDKGKTREFEGLEFFGRVQGQINEVIIHKQKSSEQELSYRNRSRISCTHNTLKASVGPNNYDTVTWKSRLRVTQGHWIRNHWIDHTRLTVSRVLWHWILSWPWNVGKRSLKSLKMVPFESLGTVFYSPCMVTMAVSLAILEIFIVK